jgi:transposase InsO family protein
MVDFVRELSERTEITQEKIISWVGISRGKFFDWRLRYGKANEHNALVPRDHWLTDDEERAIVEFFSKHPLEGYRRLTFMMLDADVVAASPATVYRVLSRAGLLSKWNAALSKKGTGFVQPLAPHEHWHVDISYLNIAGTFFYLCTVLDGASRAVVHWDLREQMKEADVELILEAARERFPGVKPRIISDNGPQFIARDFKEYVRLTGMTHVRTAPYYPQSNGKLERFHKTIKGDAIRPAAPQSEQEGRRVVAEYVEHYNGVRLHSAIGYVTPNDVLADRQKAIWAARDEKLARARELRAQRRAAEKAAA